MRGVRDEGVEDALVGARMGLSKVKAANIIALRQEWDEGMFVEGEAVRVRREGGPRGLGPAKFSFAACLIAPFRNDMVCLDTHMLQMWGWPNNKPTLNQYEAVEDRVMWEADRANFPPFVYQWAVWDWKRGQAEAHEFLWEGE